MNECQWSYEQRLRAWEKWADDLLQPQGVGADGSALRAEIAQQFFPPGALRARVLRWLERSVCDQLSKRNAEWLLVDFDRVWPEEAVARSEDGV